MEQSSIFGIFHLLFLRGVEICRQVSAPGRLNIHRIVDRICFTTSIFTILLDKTIFVLIVSILRDNRAKMSHISECYPFKMKMIGTTSIEVSHEEIMYPSFTVCPHHGPEDVINGQNLSIFHRSLNMSEVIHTLRFYRRNRTGHWYKETYRPHESKEDIRDIS